MIDYGFKIQDCRWVYDFRMMDDRGLFQDMMFVSWLDDGFDWSVWPSQDLCRYSLTLGSLWWIWDFGRMDDLSHFGIWWISVTLWLWWWFDSSTPWWRFNIFYWQFWFVIVLLVHLVYYSHDFYGYMIFFLATRFSYTGFGCCSTLFLVNKIFWQFFMCRYVRAS